jgi:uncharacterized membrane protein/Mg-chelatase subunit ChlD
MTVYGQQIGFNRPEYLLLLLVLPVLWFWSFKSLAGLGKIRRVIILLLTSTVVTLLVAALAEIQLQQISDRVTVVYLLDQSESIPAFQREAMLKYVKLEVDKHRNSDRGDRAGLIVFGREPAIELPPFADKIEIPKLESLFEVRTDATNLAAALKMAQAMFKEDTAKRVVLVTDGNENIGDVKQAASVLAQSGIGIDTVPIDLNKGAEVAVERVAMPTDVRQGQPTEVRVVVTNYGKPTEQNPTGEARGTLKISRTHDGEEALLSEEAVTLAPGKNVFKVDTKLEKTGAYNYRAEFVPEDKQSDYMQQNNIATGFTQVRGKGRVLLIENPSNPGEFDFLVDRLQAMKLEVKKAPGNSPFTSLAELQGFDTVVMANVPRAGTGQGGEDLVGFTDEQVMMLVRNVEQMGCGLVMFGGEQSFGCGGWAGTELEKIMPVDFQIKNDKVKPNSALAMLMHASEMAQGNHWQKVVGHKAVQMLGPNDYCGVLHWDDFAGRGDQWLWKGGLVQILNQQNSMLAKIDKMTPGDMPDFDSAMKTAFNAFQGLQGKAAIKHMIIISDGDPAPPSAAVMSSFINAKPTKITISTVAIGTHGPPGSTPLQTIANQTGGKYYVVNNGNALPSIYIQEVSKITKPLIYEQAAGFTPKVVYPHEMVQGIDTVPPITGFVLTTKKEHPLVEVSILSPKPDGGGENGTILASWQYKAGRTVVFTSDSGKRWTKEWTSWPNYDKLFSQIVRWSMRPVNEQGKFTVATDIKDGRVRVVVTALDQNDQFLNFLNMAGTATSPDPKKPATEIAIKQEGPGRYVGEFNADEAGSYFLAISPGKGYGGPLLAGVSVPYSSEFRERETNLALLETLAKYKPQGGEAGAVIHTDIANPKLDDSSAINTFRNTLARAFSSMDAWHIAALLAACVFLINVAIRRISIDPEWFAPLWRVVRRLWTREPEPVREDRLERLRSLKARVEGQIDERRAAVRFEPTPDTDAANATLEEAMRESAAGPTPDAPRPTSTSSPEEQEQESYTDRLLKAKKRAQQNKPE